MLKKIFSLLTIFLAHTSIAATVDTVTIYSNSMRKNIKCVIVKPESYKKEKIVYPTVYLLHGFSGAFNNWIERVPHLKDYADEHQLLLVCPSGDYSSWYFDSPIDSSMRYETHIAIEVPAYVDAHYRTVKDRRGRAVTGLSMGGHGGLFLGFRHAGFFGACGSMSGALAIDHITKGYDVEKRLGDTIANRRFFEEYSAMYVMERYPKDSLSIIIDCGTEDGIIDMSRAAHHKMLALKIPHEYIERPGRHNWSYWATAVQYQLLYFKNYFNRSGYNSTKR